MQYFKHFSFLLRRFHRNGRAKKGERFFVVQEVQLCTVMFDEKNRRNLNVYNCDFLGEVCSFEIFTRMPAELTHWTLIFVCLIYFESSRIIRTKSVKVFFFNSPNPLSLLSRFTVKIDLQIGCTLKC